MTRLTYAAYGSNLHPVRLRARVRSAELLGTTFLAGYALEFHKKGLDGSGKCSLASGDPGVYVALYSLDAREKAQLDAFEHAGVGYDVIGLEIPGYGDCFTYRATASFRVPGLAPYCWYHEMVVRGCRLHGFPPDYLAALAEVATVRDPDADRRRRNWRIVAAMEE